MSIMGTRGDRYCVSPPYRLGGLLGADLVRGWRGRRVRLGSQPSLLARRIHSLPLSLAARYRGFARRGSARFPGFDARCRRAQGKSAAAAFAVTTISEVHVCDAGGPPRELCRPGREEDGKEAMGDLGRQGCSNSSAGRRCVEVREGVLTPEPWGGQRDNGAGQMAGSGCGLGWAGLGWAGLGWAGGNGKPRTPAARL